VPTVAMFNDPSQIHPGTLCVGSYKVDQDAPYCS